MVLMSAGLFLFFFVHLLPEARGLRRYLMKRYGAERYRSWIFFFSVIAVAQIIWGKATADHIELWQPLPQLRYVTFFAMPISIILLTASTVHCNIRRFVLHPMLSGVAIWAAAHLLSNADLASIILFGFFLLFSLYKQWLIRRRWPDLYYPPARWWYDMFVIVLGIIISGGVVYFHGQFFGVALV